MKRIDLNDSNMFETASSNKKERRSSFHEASLATQDESEHSLLDTDNTPRSNFDEQIDNFDDGLQIILEKGESRYNTHDEATPVARMERNEAYDQHLMQKLQAKASA